MSCLRNLTQNVIFRSSTLQCGFVKKALLVSPIWTRICITILTQADFKNRIRSHEKPENSTWSKHVRTAPKTLSISRQRFIGQNWQVEMWNYAQNSSRFKDGSNPMISFDPKFFKAAVRSTLDKIWRRCFEERIVEVCYRGLNLQMHTQKKK